MPSVRSLSVRAGLVAAVAPLLLAAPPASGASKTRARSLDITLGARSVAHGGTMAVRVRPAGTRCKLRVHRGTSRGPVGVRRRVPRSGRMVLARLGSPGRRTVVLRCGRETAKAAFLVRTPDAATSPTASAPDASSPGSGSAQGEGVGRPAPSRPVAPSGRPPTRPPAAGGVTIPPPPATAPVPPPAAGPVPNPWANVAGFSWGEVRDAPDTLLEAQGAAVGSRLFVFGGFTSARTLAATAASHAYVPATDEWQRVADAPQQLTHSPVAVDGTTIYLVGGYVGRSPGPATDRVWKYDVTADAWSAGPSLPAPRGAGGAAIVGRELHYFGGTSRSGSNGDPDQADHWALALDGGTTWEPRAPMPNPRNHLAGAALGGKVYALGGQHGENEAWGNQSQVDVYDPATDRWTRAADMPAARGHISASAVVVGGRIVVIGGTRQGNYASASVTAYDPATDAWTSLPSLPQGRKTPVADFIDGDLYVATGSFRLPTLRGRFQP